MGKNLIGKAKDNIDKKKESVEHGEESVVVEDDFIDETESEEEA